MGDYLFKVGSIVKVQGKDDKDRKMLIIGTCVRDNEDKLHDYAGVPYPAGYKNEIACFEHREIAYIEYKGGDD